MVHTLERKFLCQDQLRDRRDNLGKFQRNGEYSGQLNEKEFDGAKPFIATAPNKIVLKIAIADQDMVTTQM